MVARCVDRRIDGGDRGNAGVDDEEGLRAAVDDGIGDFGDERCEGLVVEADASRVGHESGIGAIGEGRPD